MCFYCRTKPFGFTEASRRRPKFIASDACIEKKDSASGMLELANTIEQGLAADVIIENANVLTLNAKTPLGRTVVVCGEKIFIVSNDRTLGIRRTQSTKIINAGGRLLIFGSHFIHGCLTYAQEVSWDGVSSLALALHMIKERANLISAPRWIYVSDGWTPHQFNEKRLPTLDEISAASGDVPCFVMKLCDCAFINRAGLRALGWTRATLVPEGGLVSRDSKGHPSGMLIPVPEPHNLLAVFGRNPELSTQ